MDNVDLAVLAAIADGRSTSEVAEMFEVSEHVVNRRLSTKIRGRDLSVNKVSLTLGGKKLGTVKVEDGRFRTTKVVPKSLSGRTVLRVLDRKGEVLARTVVRVLKAA